MRAESARLALVGVRGIIDGIDDVLLALLAVRRRLVSMAAQVKSAGGQPGRDLDREQEIFRRARRLAQRLGLPTASSDRLIALLIDDACRQQELDDSLSLDNCARPDPDQGGAVDEGGMIASNMANFRSPSSSPSWFRLLPPPTRLAPLLRRVPSDLQAWLLESAIRHVLAAPLSSGALVALQSRRLGIEVSDLGLHWVVELCDGRIRVCRRDEPAEATVRGNATDLLLLASRREDADSLFFQRRLALIGDTELGLTARNLLDQLPWDDVPLGLRIALHRVAGLALAAQTAHRDARAAD